MRSVKVKIPAYLDRMILESEKLFYKKQKLSNYIDKKFEDDINNDDEECFECRFELEIAQHKAMSNYLENLMDRVNRELLNVAKDGVIKKIKKKEEVKKFD